MYKTVCKLYKMLCSDVEYLKTALKAYQESKSKVNYLSQFINQINQDLHIFWLFINKHIS